MDTVNVIAADCVTLRLIVFELPLGSPTNTGTCRVAGGCGRGPMLPTFTLRHCKDVLLMNCVEI